MSPFALLLVACSDFDLKAVEEDPTGRSSDTTATFDTATETAPTTPPDTCMGLGEAWDRGFLHIQTDGSAGSLLVESSATEDVCVDAWYIALSEESQDAAFGDPAYNTSAPYPEGTQTVPAADLLAFGYAAPSATAWWCVEETQYTQPWKEYSFTGAYVPDAVLGFMLAGNQDAIWGYQDQNPLLIVGRGRNHLEATDGESVTVSFNARNLGSRPGSGTLWETVPAGFTATDFSSVPDAERANSDGSTSYGFDISVDARRQGTNTSYSESAFTYTLTMPERCPYRTVAPEVMAEWSDRDGVAQVSMGNPLVVYCD